ncbi:MAG: conjugal transfer protein TraG N-terminal domain-containing protein [Rhodocyclaceae bacterium]|nr:conjugal transfer protein TraG N-terminal domain-containing protein [Rhodocyclaceae bacterium]
MSVDSYLELFTTMYGWAFAGIFRDILVDTGIVFLPFIITIISVWLESHQMARFQGADAAWMVRKMEVEFMTAIFVLALCFSPLGITSLANVNLYHTPPATPLNPTPTTATGTAPDSTYGAAFGGVPTTLAIPPWWFTVMSLSSGFNEAVRGGIAGGLTDLRAVEELARTAMVQDPQLRGEIQRFYNECYIPARSRYLRNGPTAATAAAVATHGDADPDWMGSHAFLDEARLYPSLYAEAGVPGFALDLTGADADLAGNTVLPAFGRPTCSDWWLDASSGLRARMASFTGPATLTRLPTAVANVFTTLTATDREDALARLAMERSQPSAIQTDKIIGIDAGVFQQTMQAVPNVVGIGGMLSKAFETQASRFPIIQFAAMAQPLILMGIYMFLPLILVFGRYSLQVMFMGALAIFTVKSWAAMWYIARWLDEHLMVAMYPGADTLLHSILIEPDAGAALKRTTLNTLLVGLYVGLPLIWSGMMSWIGFHIMRGIENVQGTATTTGKAAGATGAGLAKTVVSGGRGAMRAGGKGR